MTDAIKREMRRRPAIEPVIGHAKSDHRMDRNYLAGEAGDAINAMLATAGYNFRRCLAWFRLLLTIIWTALTAQQSSRATYSSRLDQQTAQYFCNLAMFIAPCVARLTRL